MLHLYIIQVMAQLADAKSRLAAVQSRLAELQAGFDESLAKKAELEAKAQRCETQLTNAGRLLGKLHSVHKAIIRCN
jgi:DNA repair exonuclease SbcCD ATPase subunit